MLFKQTTVSLLLASGAVFAASCAEAALFPGAAPITLIDGDRLLELLIENNVGIRRSNAVELLDVDLELFDEYEME